jgi:glycosyltransferase involved in cell wall biosynthesis
VRRWDARALPRLIRAAPRQGVVHLQFQAAAYDLLGDICLVPALLHRLAPTVKVVTTFHDTRVPFLFPTAGRLRPAAVRLLARTSDAVVTADARDLTALGGPSPRHFAVPIGSNVRCEPPLDFDRDEFRHTVVGVERDSLVVAYFGLLNASKGLDLLLDVFARILTRRPGARLLLLGGDVGASDPSNADVARRVRARAEPGVVHTGWLAPTALSAYLLSADVALLPYTDGASGRRGSLLACAEHGLPIVSTTPAAPEVADAVLAVTPGVTALAEAVLGVASDPARAAALRSASRGLAARHTWPAIAAAHVAIYEGLRGAT